MRRFPPPPSMRLNEPSPTPKAAAERRSTEAPMQFEYQTSRSFPASAFQRQDITMNDARIAEILQEEELDHDGERARKRTHYEAMDIDTPPRTQQSLTQHDVQLDPLPSLPVPSTHPSRASSLEPLAFNSSSLSAPAPSTHDRSSRSPSPDPAHLPVAITSEANETRRRRNGAAGGGRRDRSLDRKGKAKQSDRCNDPDDNDDDDDDYTGRSMGLAEPGIGGGGVLGERIRNGEFTFQVHHHHGSSASEDQMLGIPQQKGLDRHTPYVLLGYLHFTSLALLLLLFLSLSVLFIHTLYTDITDRLSSLTVDIRAEILICAKAYVDNLCDAATRIPMSEAACAGWERCMSQEVKAQGRARVTAEVLAEVVNGFVEVISVRTMLFVLLSLGTTIYFSQLALSCLPSSAPPHPAHLPHHPSQFSFAPHYQQHPSFQLYPRPRSVSSEMRTGGRSDGAEYDDHRSQDGAAQREKEKRKNTGWFSR